MSRNPEEREVALECLRLAVSNAPIAVSLDPVKEAGRFYAFVTGTEPATARDKINAALDEAGVR